MFLNPDSIIQRYMYFVKTVCGDEAEIMLEEVLKHGSITAVEVIEKTHQKMIQTHCKYFSCIH